MWYLQITILQEREFFMIGIIFVGDLRYCPYINTYLRIMDQEKTEYTVYFWNREGIDYKYKFNAKGWNQKSLLSKKKIGKIFDFLGFSRWLNNTIVKDKPNKIIFLSTLSLMMMNHYTIQKYSGRYFVDIRDYSYEKYLLFRVVEYRFIKKARYCSISSPAFENFLIKGYNYLHAHNFDRTIMSNEYRFIKKQK